MFHNEGSTAMGEDIKEPQKCENLEELFESWKEKYGKNTSFVPDGFLREEVEGKEEGKEEGCDILFISKESHEERKDKDDKDFDDFWMKRMVTGVHKDCKNDFDKGGIVFPRHLAAIYNKLYPKEDLSKDKYPLHWSSFEEGCIGEKNIKFPTLLNCGYMNLNKHGGGAQVSKNFAKIVKEDKDYIQRQIELMRPQMIVMLGANLSKHIEGIQVNYTREKEVCVYETYHPRARKKYEDYIKKLDKTLIRDKKGFFQWEKQKE